MKTEYNRIALYCSKITVPDELQLALHLVIKVHDTWIQDHNFHTSGSFALLSI